MKRILPLAVLAMTMASSSWAATTPSSIDAFLWQRRVILISAPASDDPRLLEQRQALAEWRQEAEDRDVTTIQLVGAAVEGVGDKAHDLRKRFNLPTGSFSVVLIGKDGHIAVRSSEPVTGTDLVGTIDAMPMRRAGQR